jgi:uncharacterized membrane protein
MIAALVPPVQSPDEHSHLARAWLLSQGELSVNRHPAQGPGGYVDAAWPKFFDAYLKTVAVRYDARLTPRQEEEVRALRFGEGRTFQPLHGAGYYFPAIYAPQVAAFALGRALDLGVHRTYWLARLACIGAVVALLALACRVARPPPLAAALVLLPMTVFQMLSPTIDGLTTALTLLALALFQRLVAGRDGRPWDFAVLCACCVLVCTTRLHMLPLLALPVAAAMWRRGRGEVTLALVTVMAVVGWLDFAMSTAVDTRVARGATASQILGFYLVNPAAFFEVVGRSLNDPRLGAFYADSFIGVLAWLDTRLPQAAYPLLWLGLALLVVVSSFLRTRGRDAAFRAVLILCALASIALVFLALLVSWTPHPAQTVQGVQGRYFIGPALMLAYGIGAPQAAGSGWRRGVWALSVGSFALGSLGALVATLLARYH